MTIPTEGAHSDREADSLETNGDGVARRIDDDPSPVSVTPVGHAPAFNPPRRIKSALGLP